MAKRWPGVSAMLAMHQDWHDVFDDLEALAEVLVASQLPWVATVFSFAGHGETMDCSLKFFCVLLQQFVGISCRSFCYLQAKSWGSNGSEPAAAKAIFNAGDEHVGEEAVDR